MADLRALLFDVDGTLAETERDGHRAAFNQAFADYGLPWHWSEKIYGALLRVTGGKERIEHFAQEHDPQWLALPGSSWTIGQIHKRKNLHYQHLLHSGHISLRKGLRQLLSQARAAGLLLGVVTTTSRSNLDVLLATTLGAEIRAEFRVCVTGEDVAHKKPDPECYRLALVRLGLPPACVLAVEDSRNGLLAAHGAGVQSLIVRSFYFEHEDFSEALAVVDDFYQAQLPNILHLFG